MKILSTYTLNTTINILFASVESKVWFSFFCSPLSNEYDWKIYDSVQFEPESAVLQKNCCRHGDTISLAIHVKKMY